MNFLHIEFLYGIIFISLLFLIKDIKKDKKKIFSKEVLEKLQVKGGFFNTKLRNIFLILALIFALITLSRPYLEKEPIKFEVKASTLILALDISNSMNAIDIYPNRISFAKEKLLKLVDYLDNYLISILAFSSNSYLLAPFSIDKSSIKFLIKNIDSSSLLYKGTNFYELINNTNKLFKDKEKVLVLITDGGDQKDFSKEIDFAKKNNIKIFILAVATKKGSAIPYQNSYIKYKNNIVISSLNENIKSLSQETGGFYTKYSLSDEDIKNLVKEINKFKNAKKVKEKELKLRKELFIYPLYLSLLFALLSLAGKRKKELMLLLLLSTPKIEAGIFDFIALKNAKEAYEKKDYNKSINLYEKLKKDKDSKELYYNLANAYYKNKEYKKALKYYQEAKGMENESLRLYNKGNANFNLKDYKGAIKDYEASLKLKDDNSTKKNLKIAKELLKKEKKKEEENKKQKAKSEEKKQKEKQSNKQNKQNSEQNKEDKKAKEQTKKEEKQVGDEKKRGKTKEEKKEGPSKKEESKWFKMLDKNKAPTKLYQIQRQTKRRVDESPW